MRRLWRVYRRFFASSFQRDLQFRANFWAKVIRNIVWMLYFLLILHVIYLNTDSVAGWDKGDAYILMATCFLMSATIYAFFGDNLLEIPEKVRRGTLDYDIIKPIDTQFLVSVRKFKLDELGTLVVGVLLVFTGVRMGGYHPSGFDAGAYALLVVCSTVIFYCFKLSLMTLSVWFVRVDNLWVLGDSVVTLARYPLEIFGPNLQRIFTYFVPLAFIATVPSKALMGNLPPIFLLYGVLWALLFLALSRWFFRFALRHYTSASS
ncbi:MAG: ABC-2 family transporter protein [Armatimonadetes bacterium]|nr:ABC-2 family transporter protein [Armatimonadota bacterium]